MSVDMVLLIHFEWLDLEMQHKNIAYDVISFIVPSDK